MDKKMSPRLNIIYIDKKEEFGDDVVTLPDFAITDYVSAVIMLTRDKPKALASSFTIKISNSDIIDEFRLRVVSGELEAENIVFKHGINGENIAVNEYGAITYWPKGFGDHNVNRITSILKRAYNKKKALK